MNIFKPSGAKILKEVNQIKLNQTFILKPGCWSKFLFIFNFVQTESSWYTIRLKMKLMITKQMLFFENCITKTKTSCSTRGPGQPRKDRQETERWE